MRRREFLAGLGSVAAGPLGAQAQQPERVHRIGVLINGIADDPLFLISRSAFLQALPPFAGVHGRQFQDQSAVPSGHLDELVLKHHQHLFRRLRPYPGSG
jgi:hypothetical protein